MKVFLVIFLMSGLYLSQGINAAGADPISAVRVKHPFFVRTLAGKTLSFEINDIRQHSAGSLDNIKELIAERLKIKPENIILSMGGKKMESDADAAKIHQEDTLFLTMKPE